MSTCWSCKGKGRILIDPYDLSHETCTDCNGTGSSVEYRHDKLYVYDATTQTFDAFVPQLETWPAWFGRRAADGCFLVGMYYLLKWCGVVVLVAVP